MQNQEIIKSIECDVPHKCSKNAKDLTKKCAQCEIGYSFVACEPRTLECGHLVCLECKSKVEKGSLKCKICGVDAKYTEVQGISAHTLFQVFLNDFTKELKDKYKAALQLYDGIFNFKISINSFFSIKILFRKKSHNRDKSKRTKI